VKKPIFLFILLFFLTLAALTLAAAQNSLYVRVAYNPSMQLLGFGGSGFFYDHILLLPDGTAYRFDDVSDDFDQVLPSNISLATATATDLANAGGTQGTYQDDGATIQTSFGVSFASAGEEYDANPDESGYMFIPPLQPSFITGEYNNFSGTVIGGGFTNTPAVSAGESNNYFFYADGKFGFEESSGVSSDAGNVGVTSSSEGSAAGGYFFEGYNLYITYNDGSEAVLPAYLWPPYQSFVDQILMVGEDEFLNEEESAIPIQLLPATGATNNQPENPLGGNQAQNPLGNGGNTEPQNPLGGNSNAENPLAQPSEPAVSSDTMLSGTVTFPTEVAVSVAFVTVCPMSTLGNQEDCSTISLEASGSYSVELPAAEGDLMVMAAMDTDGNNQLNTGDYVAYQTFNPADGLQIDLVLTPYTE
jgi:hypothetical protein